MLRISGELAAAAAAVHAPKMLAHTASLKFLQIVILQCTVLELQLDDLDHWALLLVRLSIPQEVLERAVEPA
jgi:hypothetical protein